MGFRFYRRFRIGPGLRANLSKSGVSESIARRDAWFTIGPGVTRSTVGPPRTGLSPVGRTPIRQGRTATAGLLVVVVVIGLLLAVVALFA